MSTGANWLVVEAAPAWAHAAGINEFMHAPDLDEVLIPKVRPESPGDEGAALCHRVRPGPPGSRVAGRESLKSALLQGPADVAHQFQVKVQVVQGIQAAAQDLIAAVQVPQVRARVVRAGVAAALRVDRGEVHGVAA